MALKPITRKEQIIAGKDLTPITRKEMFLKQLAGGSGGGGAGAGEMVVHVTNDDGAPWFSADKTFEEIAEAVENGVDVRLVWEDGEYVEVCPLARYEAGYQIKFSNLCHTGSDTAGLTTYYVRADGPLTRDYSEISLGTGVNPD